MRKAFRTTIPVMGGYLFLGIGFGILMKAQGFGVLYSALMAVFIYAGSMQYAGVSLLASGASLLNIALTTLFVNARHIFYGITMVQRYRKAGRYKPYMIFALTDETYSLLLEDREDIKEEDRDRYRFYVSLFDHIYWVSGCVLGALSAQLIPISIKGLDFVLTALFVAIFCEQWQNSSDHIPALIGLFITLICLLVFGSGNFLIPSMFLMILALSIYRRKRL